MALNMTRTDKQRKRLISLLEELFQLNQPDLDFGFYKIMHAKAQTVSDFVGKDLLQIIKDTFGEADEAKIEQTRLKYEQAIEQAKSFGASDPETTEPVRKAKAAYDAAKDSGANEGEIYEHLYRFFERYYDNGDFMSRRYFARETGSKAAPYAVPYDGREVYLHWANRDQYYIKTSEYLTNFTFDIARHFTKQERVVYNMPESLKLHCRIADAAEGEHNNNKTTDKTERFFMIYADKPVVMENGDLVLQFEYRPDNEKSGQTAKWQEKRIDEAESAILHTLTGIGEAESYNIALQTKIGEDKNKRTLLRKYLNQYTKRNTTDYFIHKDLEGFLKRELDFYIKNEIMRLDDIENADAPRVEDYLDKIKVLRKIARQLITFLAQLEEFQKKLWLKKKFVTETQYCITLDRIPEDMYAEITANDAQRADWVSLFAIDELDGYSEPLNVDFLKANPFLVLDTAFFTSDFKDALIAGIQDCDESLDGLMIHSENFQALGLMQKKMNNSIDSIYIDPPYNTSASEIIYKNSYKHSSWMSLIENRVSIGQSLMKDNALMCITIDDVEFSKLYALIENQFSSSKIAGVVPIRINPSGRPTEKGFALTHEYAIFSAGSEAATIYKMPRSKSQLKRFKEEDSESIFEWRNLRREGSNSDRGEGEKQYFPIFADIAQQTIRVPFMEWIEQKRSWEILERPEQHEVEIWPVNGGGREKNWRWSEENIRKDYSQFKARIPKGSNKPQVYYKYRPNLDGTTPLTLWTDTKYSATEYGTQPLKDLFIESQFSYPKSIYAVEDCLSIMGIKNSNTHVLDFFAGSGTTAHAVINMSRMDQEKRKFTLCEMGQYFDQVTLPRVKKVVTSSEWSNGKPENIQKAEARFKKQISEYEKELKYLKGICDETEFEFHNQRLNGLIEYLIRRIEAIKTQKTVGNFYGGISHAFKYIRLESYEDTLNNLSFREDADRDQALQKNDDFRREYMLKYWLDFETKGSPSLLNIDRFDDPASYLLKLKKPGSDEYEEKAVDLIESFNWLIGLHVDHLDKWCSYDGRFTREPDPELPGDDTTRLILDGRMKEAEDGNWLFRKVEGRVCRTPGDMNNTDRVLVIWRKLTDNLEEDNLMLDEWFKKYRLSTQDGEFDVIYVNGSNNLQNLRQDDEHWKVRLIEETFHRQMWDVEA